MTGVHHAVDAARLGVSKHTAVRPPAAAWERLSRGGLVFEAPVSLSLRLKDLLGPVTRVKKTCTMRSTAPASGCANTPLPFDRPLPRSLVGSGARSLSLPALVLGFEWGLRVED